MSDIHPFQGEGLSYEQGLRFWDEYSDRYSGFQQGDIPVRIVERLVELGVLGPTDDVLEIGSGPGTYSLGIAPRVGRLTCLDTSPRMLDRLTALASDAGVHNLVRLDMDWNDVSSEKVYDTCIATLCPGTGSPASIVRMETASRHWCVLVSWVENHGDDLHADVWKRLGKDYGYGARLRSPAMEWLSSNGRAAVEEVFHTVVEADIPVEDLVARELSSFAAMGRTEGVEDAVREVLEPSVDGDVVHYRAQNSMRMVYWEPLL